MERDTIRTTASITTSEHRNTANHKMTKHSHILANVCDCLHILFIIVYLLYYAIKLQLYSCFVPLGSWIRFIDGSKNSNCVIICLPLATPPPFPTVTSTSVTWVGSLGIRMREKVNDCC